MLQCERVDISEGINIDTTNASKECKICYYWYFGTLKILVLSMSRIFAMVVMVLCKKLLVLMILLLFMVKEVLAELTFGI